MHSVIERIRKRPVLYLGGESITALWHFISGYDLAELDHKIEKNQKSILPLSFGFMHEYVFCRLGIRNTKSWCNNILDSCNGDEKAALHKFFEYYDEFSSAEVKHCERAVLTEENIRHNNSMEHGYSIKNGNKEPLYREPKAVYITELSVGCTILSVETASESFITYWQIFDSGNKAREHILTYAESIFGKLDFWEEVSAP